MERAICDLTLELSRSYSPLAVAVKRGDTHRTLRIRLSQEGRPYGLEPGCSAVFTAVKPDGSHLFNACRIQGGAILYDLTPQTTAVPGELACELRLYGEGGALLTTAAFQLTVADTVYQDGDENVASTGEATALTKLIAKVDEKIAEIDAALENEANHAIIDDTKIGADAWSSKQIVDMLCPGFTAEGPAVTCSPLEGYPLEVVSRLAPGQQGVIRLRQSGKNILDVATAGFYHGNSAAYWCDHRVTETGLRFDPVKDGTGTWYVAGFYLGTAKELAGKTITVSAKVSTSIVASQLPWIQIAATDVQPTSVRNNPTYLDGGYLISSRKTLVASSKHNGYATATYTVTGEETYPYVAILFQFTYGGDHVVGDWTEWSDIQVEIGDTATAYEPYRGTEFTADLTAAPEVVESGSYNWITGLIYNGESYYCHEPETGTFRLIDKAEDADRILRHIPALTGENVFYSSCGHTLVTGRKDIRSLLEKQQ